MEIRLQNRGKEKLAVTVLYGFLVEDLTGKSSRQRDIGLKNLMSKGWVEREMTIEGQKDASFVTETIATTEFTIGDRKYGSKDQSFVVQVYWKGQLLHGWAADSGLKDMANDPDLMKVYRGR